MADPYQMVVEQIAQVNQEIGQLEQNVFMYTQDANAAARGYSYAPPIDDVKFTKPAIAPFNTSMDFSADYNKAYDDLIGRLGPQFKDMFKEFVDAYFPKGLMDDVVNWLDDVIRNGYRGIPDEHYNNIWNKARDRELRDLSRLEDESVSGMAARGWSIPNGAMAARLYTLHQEANAKIASISRDIAIKDVEVKVEMTKFAVQEAVALITKLWDALLDYLRAYLSMEGYASTYANQLVGAKSILYDSMYKYYDSLIKVEQLAVNVDEYNKTKKFNLAHLDVDTYYKHAELMANTAMSTAKMYGEIMKGMSGSRNTLITGGQFTTTTS